MFLSSSPIEMKKRDFNCFVVGLRQTLVLLPLIIVSAGGELPEAESLGNFIRAVDPQNVLKENGNLSALNPCLRRELKGIKCNKQETSIVEIKLENSNLSGTIDAFSLCLLPNLRVVSLAQNRIHGSIPNLIYLCQKLTSLNLSTNHLTGAVPNSLAKLKCLRILDVSNNHISKPPFFNEFKQLGLQPSVAFQRKGIKTLVKAGASELPPSESPESSKPRAFQQHWYIRLVNWISVVLGVGFFALFIYLVGQREAKLSYERQILRSLQESPVKVPPSKAGEQVNAGERLSELVFFVEESERFDMEDLLEATAHLRSQKHCSSFFKVKLRDNACHAVKRLKKLQISSEEFGETMKKIGNIKHPNILPLVGYCSTEEGKLLIYKYQDNGSLLELLESHIEGKRRFPWRLRLSVAWGIANGLAFIHQWSKDEDHIPHGNLKLSNILLSENHQPQISEYGISKFLVPNGVCMLASAGYAAPERSLTEEADVYSFGTILLELLTGKTVEKSGIDLPKWVRAKVTEEWTGEVFDKEVARSATRWACPLLNIALKCVSRNPVDRPRMAAVLEKIDEIMRAPEDHSNSSASSDESNQQDFCLSLYISP